MEVLVETHSHYEQQIAIARPQTLAELAGISGVGDRKLEAYGQAILELVAAAG